MKEHQVFIIKKLEEALKSLKTQNSGERELFEAMQYSLISKTAKYIRSFLILEISKMLNGQVTEDSIKVAMAIEMIHCYSLIHDDLPSMDNSDFRRNEPALHKVFPESTAVLAGNSLLTLAFEILTEISNPIIALKIIKKTSEVAGIFGIMSGQVLDLNPKFKKNEFETMNYHKTGKLIELCCILPAILLEKPTEELAKYGKALGKAYQMQDDLLDEGEEAFSYLNKFKTKEALQEAIKQEVETCVKAISNFKNNDVLKELPYLLAKRSF